MLTLESVKDWLKANVPEVGSISVGAINADKDKCIGVYNQKQGSKQRICIGGKEQTKYLVKRVSILIHWTNSPVKAEQKAIEIYELLYGLSFFKMGETQIYSITLSDAPMPIGKDEKGICEYVIEAEIYYERS